MPEKIKGTPIERLIVVGLHMLRRRIMDVQNTLENNI